MNSFRFSFGHTFFFLLIFTISFPLYAELNCIGIGLDWDKSEKELMEIVSPFFKDRSIQIYHEREDNSYTIYEKQSRTSSDWWDAYYLLQEKGAKQLEMICSLPPQKSIEENRESGVIDSFCLNTTPEDWENKSQYKSCDPLWIHKATGLLQKDEHGEWNQNWIYDLLEKKKKEIARKMVEMEEQGYQSEYKILQQQYNEIGVLGKGILIGHPDTGYTDHPELGNGQIDHPEDYTIIDPDPYDHYGPLKGHGTSTASVIISPPERQDDGPLEQYVYGVLPYAHLRPYKVANGSVVHFIFPNVVAAIYSAIHNNEEMDHLKEYSEKVRVLSMSLGGPLPSPRLHKALSRALKAGIIPIAASGNFIPEFIFKKFIIWPARYYETIAVAATDVYSNPWIYSSRGPQMDIAAPGQSVWRARTTYDGDKEFYGVARSSGTSYATAITAGIIALWIGFHGETVMKQYDPYRIELFRFLLEKLAKKKKLGPILCNRYKDSCPYIEKGYYGLGIINAKELLEMPLPRVEDFMVQMREKSEQRRESDQEDSPEEMFAGLFPQVPPPLIHKEIRSILNLSQEKYEQFLQKHAYELAFILVDNEKLYSLFDRYLKIRHKFYNAPFTDIFLLTWRYGHELKDMAQDMISILSQKSSFYFKKNIKSINSK